MNRLSIPSRTLIVLGLCTLTVVVPGLQTSAAAYMRAGVRHGGGGPGGPSVHGRGPSGGNQAAYRAGARSGYRQGAHRGYHAGVNRGLHYGAWAHPWAFRAPVLRPWHPIGWTVVALATTAIIVSAANSNSGEIYYSDGMYYEKTSSGYKAVPPPEGARIPQAPPGYISVSAGGVDYFYYQGDFYVEQNNQYIVVRAPVGAKVPYVPDAATAQTLNGTEFYVYNGVQYVGVSSGGDTSYLVTRA